MEQAVLCICRKRNCNNTWHFCLACHDNRVNGRPHSGRNRFATTEGSSLRRHMNDFHPSPECAIVSPQRSPMMSRRIDFSPVQPFVDGAGQPALRDERAHVAAAGLPIACSPHEIDPQETQQHQWLRTSESLRDYVNLCDTKSPGSFGRAAALVALRSSQLQQPNWFFLNSEQPSVMQKLGTFLKFAMVSTHTNPIGRAFLASGLRDLIPMIQQESSSACSSIRLPHTVGLMHKHWHNTTNQHSLVSSLPTPVVRQLDGTQVGFVCLQDALAHAMVFPHLRQTIDPGNRRHKSLVKSRRFQWAKNNLELGHLRSRRGRRRYLVLAQFWSDGWDPNRLSKSNRGSVWSVTVCFIIVLLEADGTVATVSVVNQLLCCASEQEDHFQYLDILRDEIQEFKTEDGKLKPHHSFCRTAANKGETGICVVHLCPGVMLQDNPERRKSSGLLAGNSNLHAMFGVSCDFKNLKMKFHACKTCEQKLTSYIEAGRHKRPFVSNCKECHCWSVEGTNELTCKTAIQVPGLTRNDPGEGRRHKGGKFEYPELIGAWNHGILMYCQPRKWNATTLREYFKLFCMNDSLVDKFLEQAKRHRMWMDINSVDSPEFDDEHHRLETLAHCEMFPELYSRPSHPAMWDMFEIGDQTEAIMHSSQNCQKAALVSLIKYCSRFSKGTQFCKLASMLANMVKLLRLEKIRAMGFKDKKFGGLVAENFAAIALLFPWISLIFYLDEMKPSKVADKPTTTPDPKVKPHSKWTKAENQLWCDLRKIPHAGKNAKQLRKLVKDWKDDPNCPEPMEIQPEEQQEKPKPKPHDEPPDTARKLLLAAHKMFKVMHSCDLVREEGRNRLQAHVMAFLSLWHRLDKLVFPEAPVPVYLSKYNSMGLLRMCEAFMNFEAPGNLHEGGNAMGEGVVKALRQMCPAVARDGWSRNLLHSFYRQKAIDVVMNDMDQLVEDVDSSHLEDDDLWLIDQIDTDEDCPGEDVLEGDDSSGNGVLDMDHFSSNLGHRSRYRKHKESGVDSPSAMIEGKRPFSVTFYRCPQQNKRKRTDFEMPGLLLGVVTKQGLVALKVMDKDKWVDPFGFTYFRLEVCEEIIPFSNGINIHGFTIVGHGLGLPAFGPMHDQFEPKAARCAFLSDEWKWFDGSCLV